MNVLTVWEVLVIVQSFGDEVFSERVSSSPSSSAYSTRPDEEFPVGKNQCSVPSPSAQMKQSAVVPDAVVYDFLRSVSFMLSLKLFAVNAYLLAD